MNRSLRILIAGLLLFVMPACQGPNEQPTMNDDQDITGMLEHNVYFYLNADVTPEESEQFEAGLKELLQIPNIHHAQIGIPGATEERDVTDHDFAYSIFTRFETMEDYQVYAEHPVHIDFIDTYSHLWADVRVYDSEIIDVP